MLLLVRNGWLKKRSPERLRQEMRNIIIVDLFVASYKLKKSNEVTSIQKLFKRVPIFDSWNSRVNVEFLIQGKRNPQESIDIYKSCSYLGTKETDEF